MTILESYCNDDFLLNETLDKIELSKDEKEKVNERFKKANCNFYKTKNGKYYCRSLRLRSKLYDSIEDIPADVVKSVGKI